jgi:hypothetical protein
MAEIVCYHLITGVEIVGILVQENEEFFILEKVRRIYTTMSEGTLNVLLLPYATGAIDVDLDFYHSAVVSDYDPDSWFVEQYNKEVHGADVATTIGL